MDTASSLHVDEALEVRKQRRDLVSSLRLWTPPRVPVLLLRRFQGNRDEKATTTFQCVFVVLQHRHSWRSLRGRRLGKRRRRAECDVTRCVVRVKNNLYFAKKQISSEEVSEKRRFATSSTILLYTKTRFPFRRHEANIREGGKTVHVVFNYMSRRLPLTANLFYFPADP